MADEASPSLGADSEPQPEPQPILLDAQQRLVRIAMALKADRPTAAEISAVEADPSALRDVVSSYLETSDFGAMVKDLHAEMLVIRAADAIAYAVRMPDVGALSENTVGEIHRSMTEAPLNLVEEVVLSDMPYTEIVTADWLVTDSIHSTIWGLPYDPDGPQWQRSEWQDDRPTAGVLTEPALWGRQVNNGVNHGRRRANFVSDAFLCHDFLERDVTFEHPEVGTDLTQGEAPRQQAGCTDCHAGIDQLAGFFWGFRNKLLPRDVVDGHLDCESPAWVTSDLYLAGANCYPLLSYREEWTDQWQEHGMPPPAFFGKESADLGELGESIAADPRFSYCAAQRLQSFLHQQRLTEVPFERIAKSQKTLIDADWSYRTLVLETVLDDDFATIGFEGDGESTSTALLSAGPEQLARLVENLTGFRWLFNADGNEPCGNTRFADDGDELIFGCWGVDEIPTSAAWGVRAVAGGTDGYRKTLATHDPSAARLLLLRRLAEEASAHVVANDFGEGPIRLLHEVTEETTDPQEITRQLTRLHLEILGQAVSDDSEEVLELLVLFETVLSVQQDTRRAWQVVLTTMLQDPSMIWY